MSSRTLRTTTFLVLAVFGMALLWGIGIKNGFLVFGSKDCENGTVRSDYFNIKPFDNFLCVLVSFFEAAGRIEHTSPLLIEFGGLLIAVISIIYSESYRNSHTLIRYSPLITGILYQSFGAGIILPLWFALYSSLPPSASTSSTPTQVEVKQIESIFPAVMIGFLLPSALLSTDIFSRHNHQTLSSLWQIFPIIISGLSYLFYYLLPSYSSSSSTPNIARRHLMNYVISIASFCHLCSLLKLYLVSVSTHSSLLSTFASTYFIPINQTNYEGTSHVFLLLDYTMVALSSFLFVLFTPGHGKGKKVSLVKLGGLLLGGGVGTTICWIWMEKQVEEEGGNEKLE